MRPRVSVMRRWLRTFELMRELALILNKEAAAARID